MSFHRARRSGDVFNRFYELFLASDPEVRERFEHTDFDRQKALLQSSLEKAIFSSADDHYAHAELARIRETHGQAQLDIPRRLYDLWRDCLIQAVSEHDPDYHESIEAQWRSVLQPAIDFLTAGSQGSVSGTSGASSRLPLQTTLDGRLATASEKTSR